MRASLSAVKRTLDQIRALNAYTAAGPGKTFDGKDGGEVAKKVPGLVVMHGLLGAMAFALEKQSKLEKQGEKKEDEKKDGYYRVFEAVLDHLKSIGDATVQGAGTVEEWFKTLADVDSTQLRLTTAETLAYLTFFRRFAKKKKEGGDGE